MRETQYNGEKSREVPLRAQYLAKKNRGRVDERETKPKANLTLKSLAKTTKLSERKVKLKGNKFT